MIVPAVAHAFSWIAAGLCILLALVSFAQVRVGRGVLYIVLAPIAFVLGQAAIFILAAVVVLWLFYVAVMKN